MNVHARIKDEYWHCVAFDETQANWVAENRYQRIAYHKALDACKSQSQYPQSCSVEKEQCELFAQGKSARSLWRCVAYDDFAKKWPSGIFIDRDEAALSALSFCKSQSKMAHSCYINMLSCKNVNT